MPNFKTKKIKELVLPFEENGVKFLWKAENQNVILLYTQIEDEAFFLQIKKDSHVYVIKADKHTKPSKIAYVQKALGVFRDNFCEEILNEAFALKNNALLSKTPFIVEDFEELLLKLKGKIYIEIGFGSGRHLLYQARMHPEILVLGVEIYTPAMTQVAKLAACENLKNVLLIQSDARLLLSVLKAKSVEKIFLHFPVPWDKKPHRRVISTSFCQECARVLSPTGRFELRTDSYEYFDFALKSFLNFSHPQFYIAKNENLEVSSKYEDRWKRQEKDIYDLVVSHLPHLEYDTKRSIFIDDLCMSCEELKKFENSFKNETIKEEDYFLHIENIYKKDKDLLLKIAFGAFNKPEHTYIILGQKSSFVFKKPFETEENFKAIEKLKNKIKKENNNNFLDF